MTIYIDIDGTIAHTKGTDYEGAAPIWEAIARANALYDEGHTIVYWTARGAKSGKSWWDITKEQLLNWGVKYHELRLDKPFFDLMVDDRALNAMDWHNGTEVTS